MTKIYQTVPHQADLAFFGKITANVSHEIKNVLAIIKEESGLITDLFYMAERGRPLDTVRIKELSHKINNRIDDIDNIVKRLSRFAHSVDDQVRTIELNQLLELMDGLCQRFASIKKVKLTTQRAPDQVQITSNPFMVQKMLFMAIEMALDTAGENGEARVLVIDDQDRAGYSVAPIALAKLEPDPLWQLLRESLCAEISPAPEGLITIKIPKNLKDV